MTININVENQEALAKVLQQLMATGADITVNINLKETEEKVATVMASQLNDDLSNRVAREIIPH